VAGNAFFQLLVTLDNMFHFTSWLSEKALGALYQYRVTVPDVRQLPWTEARQVLAAQQLTIRSYTDLQESGGAIVAGQFPDPGATVWRRSPIHVRLAYPPSKGSGQ
jgi:hypothetical protein